MKIGELLLQDCFLGKMWNALHNTMRFEKKNIVTSRKKYTPFLLQGKVASSCKYNTYLGNLGSFYTGNSPHQKSIILPESFFVVLMQKT